MPGSTTWTTPITWGTADPTVSQFNQQIRDNENHLYERAPIYVINKSSDQSKNTLATPSNDSALLWTIAANEVWSFRLMLRCTDVSNGTADLKIGWSYPTSATIAWASYSVGGGSLASWVPGITTAPNVVEYTESSQPAFGLTSGNHLMMFEGIVYNSSNAGTVNFQWSQNTSNGSNVTIKSGSNLLIVRLA